MENVSLGVAQWRAYMSHELAGEPMDERTQVASFRMMGRLSPKYLDERVAKNFSFGGDFF